MTYGRVHDGYHSHSGNGAVVSHPAELVRGNFPFIFWVAKRRCPPAAWMITPECESIPILLCAAYNKALRAQWRTYGPRNTSQFSRTAPPGEMIACLP
jgi:hypothetical protein